MRGELRENARITLSPRASDVMKSGSGVLLDPCVSASGVLPCAFFLAFDLLLLMGLLRCSDAANSALVLTTEAALSYSSHESSIYGHLNDNRTHSFSSRQVARSGRSAKCSRPLFAMR